MIVSILYIFLAILALSFLVFIHEMGHYLMARWVGMRVDTFSIGFGKPIYSWKKNETTWQIGWLPFGGYVKIAGMETDSGADPYLVPNGFFSKSPFDRIKVAFMGPFVNLIFALLLFGLLWSIGGREKNFTEFTPKIGWVDPKSDLYSLGLRPGDEISSYDSHPFEGAKDHFFAAMVGSPELQVKGQKINYATGEKTPFDYKIKSYPYPGSIKGILTTGVLASANYLIYDRLPNKENNPLPEGSPMMESGLEYGDQVVWADGERIYSIQQLLHIINEDKVLLTIQRDSNTFLARVPRIRVQELKPDNQFKEELVDWQFEAHLKGIKFPNLYTIPYNLTNDAIVENSLKFIDKEKEEDAFPQQSFSEMEKILLPGDKIIAVNGLPVTHSFQILYQLQQRKVNLIINRNHNMTKPIAWTKADEQFNKEVNWADLKRITSTLGTKNSIDNAGSLVLLKPILPKMRSQFPLSPETQLRFATDLQEQKKEVESIEDPEKRSQALNLLEKQEKQWLLGIPLQDRHVYYNPNPLTLFKNVFEEIWRTLSALVTGSLNPKMMSGPIGIVQIVQERSMVSIKEALFWMAAISLNLGVLNLLPVPVLDGGTILLSLGELISGKRLKPKTLEKIVIPFAVLLIGFFIFLTYNDLSRLFENFLR